MKKSRLITIIIISLITAVTFIGCKSSSKVDVEKVREYSDPIAEEILLALNEGDYEKFSKDFDETMKEKFTQDAFNKLKDLCKSKIGDYKSKEYYGIDTKDKYIIIVYKAKFTDEPKDALVQFVFSTKDDKHYVSGLFIDSPNLRKK